MFISLLLQLFKLFFVFLQACKFSSFVTFTKLKTSHLVICWTNSCFRHSSSFCYCCRLSFELISFWWLERWHTFHHSGHFLYVHILAIVILLLASRLNGSLLFSSESFPCYFWHLSSPCWCWHSPWCSTLVFSIVIVVAHLSGFYLLLLSFVLSLLLLLLIFSFLLLLILSLVFSLLLLGVFFLIIND